MSKRRIYCLVPSELAGRLHDALRRHFRDEPEIDVVVERRHHDRRSGAERRQAGGDSGLGGRGRDRRRIRNPAGRRVAERRAPLVELTAGDMPEIPRRFRRYAEELVFVERVEPSSEQAEDADTARLVTRIQGGESALFADLYMRYFDRVYGYMRTILRNSHDAEDMTQQAFTSILEALPRYEHRGKPFRAWMFTVVRNQALNRLRDSGRIDVVEPEEIDRIRADTGTLEPELSSLEWISDRDLLTLVERLPLAQRQVLLLRYQLGLSAADVGRMLDRTPDDVRMLQHRAHKFLRHRLTALGRTPTHRGRPRGMLRRVPEATVLRARRFRLLR